MIDVSFREQECLREQLSWPFLPRWSFELFQDIQNSPIRKFSSMKLLAYLELEKVVCCSYFMNKFVLS